LKKFHQNLILGLLIGLFMNKYFYRFIEYRQLTTILFILLIIVSTQKLVSTNAPKFFTSSNSSISEEKELFTAYLEIPNGSSAAYISKILKEERLIDNALTFEIYIRNEGYSDRLRSGNYEIVSNLSYEAIVNILLIGPPLKTFEITTTEGLWLSETIDSIAIQTGYDYLSLVNTLTSGNVDSPYLTEEEELILSNWEGLLFPDTYRYFIDADGAEIFQTMANQLKTISTKIQSTFTIPLWSTSEYELFIIASLVEAEAKIKEDRPLVASVIRNRLEIGMPLQIDSTVLYSLGERKSQVLLADLQLDSLYNTYKYLELPPTPISSFGEESLMSVYQDLDTNFIYYLLTDKNGDMTFTKSYEEFLELKYKAKKDGVIP